MKEKVIRIEINVINSPFFFFDVEHLCYQVIGDRLNELKKESEPEKNSVKKDFT